MAHPITRRWHAEDLIRLRRADEQRRYLASQRSGRIDPNPHQIDAVIFALQRISQGGCILADEVGLGKTIEAGLVMAQLRAEGAERILLITPKPLLGQWRQELATLFGMETRESDRGFDGPGIFLVGREQAGSEKGAAALLESGGFDLCVIDEAHEVFAGIYRRFDRHGRMRPDSRYAKTAARVRRVLAGTPVLLLTATPIQNSLSELWGLVQYVEPTGTLLGDLPTFRTVFCEGDDRRIRPGQDKELRDRIASVCQRTLRRQAEEFMGRRFVSRHARLFDYEMSAPERELYEAVTAYLLEPNLCAFRGQHRRLLLIGFHRRMASSLPALAASLENVAQRLRRQLKGIDADTLELFTADLEDDDLTGVLDSDEGQMPEAKRVALELVRVEEMLERARAMPLDSKAQSLLTAFGHLTEVAKDGDGTGKVVIFTEALSTQDYLRDVLIGSGLVTADEVTLFRGQNTGARANAALQYWADEVGSKLPESARPSRSVAMRLALVHEFAARSRVFIATEAGGKGLNLQFCENVINYDLPWNPQRIEQRIGRCHRYGQTRDVTVINFIARDNEAQRLTFEILSRKLDLFGRVLDASDAVLYEPGESHPEMLTGALGLDVEARLREVYESARSTHEIEQGLSQALVAVGEARDELESTHQRTAGIIETRFDETVRSAFREIADDLPEALRTLDEDMQTVTLNYLDAIGAGYQRREDGERVRIAIEAHPELPAGLTAGTEVVIGPTEDLADGDPMHLGHPLVRAAVAEARQSTRDPFVVRFEETENLPESIAARRGGRGRLALLKVRYAGFEPAVELVPVVAFEGSVETISESDAGALVQCEVHDATLERAVAVAADELEDATQEALFVRQSGVDAREQLRFEEAMERVERFIEDKVLVLMRQRAELREARAHALARRDAATGADARGRAELELVGLEDDLDAAQKEIARLQARRDDDYEAWRARAHERRYAAPQVECILSVEFELR